MNGEKYFHFPADAQTHTAVKKAAADAHMSMAGWLHSTVERALDDEAQVVPLLEELLMKADQILDILKGD